MIENYRHLTKLVLTSIATAIIWLCSISGVNAQGTVYIDPSYTGSQQNGTQQYPYKSWNSVVWTNGTTYLQKAGTTFNTTGCLTITSKNNITLGAYGTGTKPKIVSSGDATTKVIDITSCYNMVINGLEVYSTTGMATAAVLIDGTGSGNNLIDNCSLHDAQWGVRILTTSAGNRILNSEIFNTKDDGVYIKDTPDIEIGYCNIYNVNLNYFINPDQSFSAGDNIQISSTNNHNFYIHHNTLDHSYTGNKFCLIAWGNNYTGTLEHNVLIGNSSQVTSCVYLHPTTNTITVRYNSIMNGNYGIYAYVSNFNVYYNKFTSNKTAICVLNNYHLRAENNVFYNNINNAISAYSGSTVVSKNNIFNISGSSKAYSTSGTLTSDYNTFNTQYSGFINGYGSLSAWRSASGQDMHSMVATPQFVNPAAGNFSLQPSSPCINAGVVCGYSQDFFGNAVPFGNSSDIGYYEHISSTNNPPVIQNQSFSIPENSANATVVGQVVATDPNQGQTLTYSITGGNTNNAFTINSTSGILSVNNGLALNFESNPQFSLQVTVTDNQSASASATMTIAVQNVNEPPVSEDQGFNLNENSSNGAFVGTIMATDPDQNQSLTYTILSGNTNQTFALNSSTGTLSVADNGLLNHESNPSFSLSIKVEDNGSAPLNDIITVSISVLDVNESPVVQNQNFTINSNIPNGSIVGQVTATDSDINQVLSYDITSGNVNNSFAINSSTGSITVVNNTGLSNYSTITLGISVSDNGNPVLSSTGQAVINIITPNQPPVIANQQFSINENAPSGSVVGMIQATDPNAGQTLTYAIVTGNYSNAFALSSSGLLTVSNSSALNFEAITLISLTVSVTDNGTPTASSQATISVSILNVNETPTVNAGQFFSVNYLAPVGTVIGTVLASDPDNNQTITYSIISGNSSGAFQIGASSGILSVANSSALRTLVNKTVYLRIQVIDNGSPQLSSNQLITVKVTRKKESGPVIGIEDKTVLANIYPNPSTSGIFNLQIDNADEINLTISIYNLEGSKILELTDVKNGTTVINLENLSRGVYILNIRGENVNEIKKLVIQ